MSQNAELKESHHTHTFSYIIWWLNACKYQHIFVSCIINVKNCGTAVHFACLCSFQSSSFVFFICLIELELNSHAVTDWEYIFHFICEQDHSYSSSSWRFLQHLNGVVITLIQTSGTWTVPTASQGSQTWWGRVKMLWHLQLSDFSYPL